MFTGLVEEVGVIRRVQRGPLGARLVVEARRVLGGTKAGESIAVNGACLTVTDIGPDAFEAECMAETLARTTLGSVVKGTAVNLERALGLGDRLGGHMVLGHVDAVVAVRRLEQRGDALEMSVELPAHLSGLIAEKGSVALDGVSLTVMRVGIEDFAVGLIPHTLGGTHSAHFGRGLVGQPGGGCDREVCESLSPKWWQGGR